MNKFTKGEQAYLATSHYDDNVGTDVHYVVPVKIVSCGVKRLVYEWEGLRYSINMCSKGVDNIQDNFGDAENVARAKGGLYRQINFDNKQK